DQKLFRSFALSMFVRTDGADEGCVTFVLHEEDHTLGNSLRYMIMKSQDVEFCGYSITHPSESKINFRIQTRGERLLFLVSTYKSAEDSDILHVKSKNVIAN
uniref:DNA-directed RNA polymerases I and III subunit RPAC2 n=1 Tax=Sinocyclocheilus grahami TaxID=75366 RepID=A0A672KWF8_SINGR